jgi:hypothetical protein
MSGLEWDSSAIDGPQRYLDRVTRDFILGIRAAWVVFTRYPSADSSLRHRSTDEFLESALGILWLAHQGIYNVGRRELRYLLEAAVKYVYVDEQVAGETPLDERLAIVADTSRVPRSSVAPVDELVIRLQDDRKAFTDAIKGTFATLSGFVHVSPAQLAERFRRVKRGEFSGFEGPITVEAFVRDVVRTYDEVLALTLEGVGPAFAGDLFVQVFDEEPDWVFHRSTFVRAASRRFDNKFERQP